MEKKNVTQAGVGRELQLQLTDFGDYKRNRIYLPRWPGLSGLGFPQFDFSKLLKGGAETMTIETQFFDVRIGHYIKLLETIRGRVGDDQVALALLEQCGKDWRVSQMRLGDQRPSGNGPSRADEPATQRQRAFLEDLQVKNIPQNLTRMQASRMIEEAQARAEAI